jgi:Uncharacterized conserved protein (DUF2203)
MKRRRERSRPMQVMHLWDRSEVTKAVPYLRSVIGSLREHWLEMINAERRLHRSANDKAPFRRHQIIEKEKHQAERQRARDQFDDALEELIGVDVFLTDPVRGLAVIPFRKDDDVAWYCYDQFAKRGLVGWRYPNDPDEGFRPLSTLKEENAKDKL